MSGSNYNDYNGAIVNIHGGVVTAYGGSYSPGIGRTRDENSRSTIYIHNTVTSVTANKGEYAQYSIRASGINYIPDDNPLLFINGEQCANITDNYTYTCSK